MVKIERVELLHSKRDYLSLFTLFLSLLILSLSWKYYQYNKLTKFDSQIVQAKVLKQYLKNNHQVLKLKGHDGSTFYTISKKNIPDYTERYLTLEIWAGNISFLEYLKGFFAFSKIIKVDPDISYKERVAKIIEQEHLNKNIAAIYQALFLAKPLPFALQQQLSNFGLSHLLAISGFHLGVLSGILFFLIKYPYKFIQNRYFPYRNYKRDTFMLIALILLLYLLFLDIPPSLLRAYAMLIIGFLLYDKNIKIISMQTLLVSVILLIALFPKLLFSIGFFLSFSGVFYIFLFLIYFKNLKKVWQFILLPFWVYLMMLPYSLVIFGNFSLYHPLSIIITSLFSIFYPLSIVLHLINYGDLFDSLLQQLLSIDTCATKVNFSSSIIYIEIFLSLLALWKRWGLYLLIFFVLSVFIYTIYYIT